MAIPAGTTLFLTNPGGKRITRRRNSSARRYASTLSTLEKHMAKRRRSKSRRRNPLALRANSRRRKGYSKRRRRNPLALRANPLALRANGKRRKGYRKSSRRRNPIALRLNGALSQLPLVRPASNLVKKVPLIGKFVAPYIAPAAAGAAGMLAVHYTMKYALPYVADTRAYGYVAPIGYTLGGVGIGLLAAFAAERFLSANAKKAIAGTTVTIGAAVDMANYLNSGASIFGDGGLFQLGMRGNGLGAVDVPLSGDAQALQAGYADASFGDAHYSGNDLDPTEGQAAIMGPSMWRRQFPSIHRAT